MGSWFKKYYFAVLAFIISLAVYIKTLAPTVTWGDSGELITAAYTLGVAHPSGYPTYTLLGKLFTFIPFGSIAWRVNFMSAIFAAFGILFLYLVLYKMTNSKRGSFIATLVFAFSSTFWSQAVLAEVYTLHIFFLTLNIFLLLLWKETKNIKWLYFFCFSFGLSMTNHITSILFVPAFIIFILFHRKTHLSKIKKKVKLIFCGLGFFFFGLLPYLYIPLRSSMNPTWNWGAIGFSLSKLLGHISGNEYRGLFLSSGFELNVGTFTSLIWKEFHLGILIVILISIIYLCFNYRKVKENWQVGFWVLLAACALIYSLLYGITDIDTYFLPVFLTLCFFLANFIKTIETFVKGKVLACVLIILFVLVVLQCVTNYQKNDL
jgi:hypothetical protein